MAKAREKVRYTNEPLGNPKVVPDLLPRRADLVFKTEAKKHNARKKKFGV